MYSVVLIGPSLEGISAVGPAPWLAIRSLRIPLPNLLSSS